MRLAFLTLCTALSTLTAVPAHPQSQIAVEKLSFDTNPAKNAKVARISATLYLPRATKPVPAMVILNSSGGVLERVEPYYAREFAQRGIAGLVVDSYSPRGVKSTVEDQNLVTTWDMENDAFAALPVLQKDKRIDASHIGLTGVSKGGTATHHSAILLRQQWRGTGSLAFAVHVPIVPGCNIVHRNAATTGAAMFFMLAELDDFTPYCLEHAERIKSAGNLNVSIKVYKGAYHGWELPAFYLPKAVNNAKCLNLIEDNGDVTTKEGTRLVAGSRDATKNCVSYGKRGGGGTEKFKREATSDLIAFLKQQGF